MKTPTEYLSQLQAEAESGRFHRVLNAWVDDKSEVARVLRRLEEENLT